MHQNASLKSRCLRGVGHLLCHLQLQAALGMRALLREVCNKQRTPPALRSLGSVTAGTGAASPAAAVLPGSASSFGRDGARQACVSPGGAGSGACLRERRWRKLSPAPGELPLSGAPFPSATAVLAAAPGAAFSPPFGDKEDGLGKGEPLCCGGKRCDLCRGQAFYPWGEIRAVAQIKRIQ